MTGSSTVGTLGSVGIGGGILGGVALSNASGIGGGVLPNAGGNMVISYLTIFALSVAAAILAVRIAKIYKTKKAM